MSGIMRVNLQHFVDLGHYPRHALRGNFRLLRLAEQIFNPRAQTRLRSLYGEVLLKKFGAAPACGRGRTVQTLGCEPGELRGLLNICTSSEFLLNGAGKSAQRIDPQDSELQPITLS